MNILGLQIINAADREDIPHGIHFNWYSAKDMHSRCIATNDSEQSRTFLGHLDDYIQWLMYYAYELSSKGSAVNAPALANLMDVAYFMSEQATAHTLKLIQQDT